MLTPQIDPPGVGDIIRYRYMWVKEAKDGNDPYPHWCVVLRGAPIGDQRYEVLVLPITTTPQFDSRHVKVPMALNEMAGLERDKEYAVVYGEANLLTWPGWDIIPVRDRDYSTLRRGNFPEGFLRGLNVMWEAARAEGKTVVVDREKLAREVISDYRRRRNERAAER